MEAKIAVLADAANVSREGKLNIMGQFDVLFAANPPVRWPFMALVVKLEATIGEGLKHKVGVRLVDEDGNMIGPLIDGTGDFGPPFRPGLKPTAQLIIGIVGATFPKHGTYTFEILVDDHNVASVPLHVVAHPGQAAAK